MHLRQAPAATVAPRVGPKPVGWAQIGAAALLGAAGVASLLIRPDAWSENPDYSARVGLGRTGWLAACCLAAAVLRSDRWGLIATWLGSLAAILIVVPLALGDSPPTPVDPGWIRLNIVAMAAYTLGMLALAFGASRIVRAVISPRHARQLLVGVTALMFAVSVGLLYLPPGTNTGPHPAPTYPG
jgi:hypothetical protein